MNQSLTQRAVFAGSQIASVVSSGSLRPQAGWLRSYNLHCDRVFALTKPPTYMYGDNREHMFAPQHV
jgi:hypothetical protein